MTPHTFHIASRGHILKMQYDDRMNWMLGRYVEIAVLSAIDKGFNGKKSRCDYVEEPLLTDYVDDMYMTQEERDEKELRKMLASEEAWILNSKRKGLKETDA